MSDPRQTALAAEHAAVYLYGVLGGRTSRAEQGRLYGVLRSAYEHHRARRDRLESQLRADGQEPVAAEPAYVLPDGIADPAGVERAALGIERSCTETYAWLVSRTSGETRAGAIDALREGAVRELALRGTPETFPGARELTDH